MNEWMPLNPVHSNIKTILRSIDQVLFAFAYLQRANACWWSHRLPVIRHRRLCPRLRTPQPPLPPRPVSGCTGGWRRLTSLARTRQASTASYTRSSPESHSSSRSRSSSSTWHRLSRTGAWRSSGRLLACALHRGPVKVVASTAAAAETVRLPIRRSFLSRYVSENSALANFEAGKKNWSDVLKECRLKMTFRLFERQRTSQRSFVFRRHFACEESSFVWDFIWLGENSLRYTLKLAGYGELTLQLILSKRLRDGSNDVGYMVT